MTPRTNQSAARLAALTARFWARVDANGKEIVPGLGPCWVWTGPVQPRRGYGEATLDGVSGSHRIAWSLKHGRAPKPGAFICHECDNPPCCNPDHLREDTAKGNSADARRRGRTARGERNGSAKLTALDALAIREGFAVGIGKTALAERYSVSVELIHYIICGRIWRDAGGPIVPRVHGKRARYSCGKCGGPGHNARSCAERAALRGAA